MMRRFSLGQRLTLLFILLMMLCATVACAVQLYTSTQYGNAMVQRLSGGLAQQIVLREPILNAQGRVDRTALKPLFDRLMTFNPSVELYVVSPDGDILADAAPPGHIQRQKIDLAPVQTFLSGTAIPVLGDDPRSQNKKVFSATPLRQDGELKGYLYIILQGEESNALAQMAWHKALWSTVLWSLLWVALFGLLIAPLAGLVKSFPVLGTLGIAGTGLTPALIALVLYALLPLVRGVVAGLGQVAPDVLESAHAMGMSARQCFWKIQLPLALPLLLRSLRVVAVQTVGMAVIAALIGAGGFGALVFQGLLSSALDLVLLGVVPTIALAVVVDALFALWLALLRRRAND